MLLSGGGSITVTLAHLRAGGRLAGQRAAEAGLGRGVEIQQQWLTQLGNAKHRSSPRRPAAAAYAYKS
jgi:hypothetical protein